MARISPEHIGLRDAADMFGVSIDTLRRRIRDNQLDEAQLVQGPFGATWVLPRAELSSIAEREQWDFEGVSRVGTPAQPVAKGEAAPPVIDLTTDGRPSAAPPSPQPVAVAAPAIIDALPRQSAPVTAPPVAPPPVAQSPVGAPSVAVPSTADSGAPIPAAAEASNPVATTDLASELGSVVSAQIAKGLSDNVEAELRAVRDAITAAEVRAVAADARTDALRAEKGRLEAQLKRAEADIEYWRSQHDRLDKDLDRERNSRMTSDKAKAVAEAETREVRTQVATLTVDLSETQSRERALIGEEARLQSELDQATMAMGWWSRRRLDRLRARSAGSTPPPPAGE